MRKINHERRMVGEEGRRKGLNRQTCITQELVELQGSIIDSISGISYHSSLLGEILPGLESTREAQVVRTRLPVCPATLLEGCSARCSPRLTRTRYLRNFSHLLRISRTLQKFRSLPAIFLCASSTILRTFTRFPGNLRALSILRSKILAHQTFFACQISTLLDFSQSSRSAPQNFVEQNGQSQTTPQEPFRRKTENF